MPRRRGPSLSSKHGARIPRFGPTFGPGIGQFSPFLVVPRLVLFSSLLFFILCCFVESTPTGDQEQDQSCRPCPVNCSCLLSGSQLSSCRVNCSNIGLRTAPAAADVPLSTSVL
ncbi:hypothetical protein NHX12_018651 [Muraenolepis orangiensis]|uniref:Uncharacterized protein n=1 Tax=Muraenolepis orangiensis TaxID=630683 RepID=A0A9Q0EYI7_9TELE|nr:hypothetical protein NHX12_018651 [Muraenolepis orangiensis]